MYFVIVVVLLAEVTRKCNITSSCWVWCMVCGAVREQLYVRFFLRVGGETNGKDGARADRRLLKKLHFLQSQHSCDVLWTVI